MKFNRKLLLTSLVLLSTVPISSCSINEVKITYRLVYKVDNKNILGDGNYFITLLYEKNHEYTKMDYELVYYQMSYFYYDTGAPTSCYETMDFGDLYLYENNEYTYLEEKLLKIGDVFTKDATYVCYSDYNPNIDSEDNKDIILAC